MICPSARRETAWACSRDLQRQRGREAYPKFGQVVPVVFLVPVGGGISLMPSLTKPAQNNSLYSPYVQHFYFALIFIFAPAYPFCSLLPIPQSLPQNPVECIICLTQPCLYANICLLPV
jgi:hypothetical protein